MSVQCLRAALSCATCLISQGSRLMRKTRLAGNRSEPTSVLADTLLRVLRCDALYSRCSGMLGLWLGSFLSHFGGCVWGLGVSACWRLWPPGSWRWFCRCWARPSGREGAWPPGRAPYPRRVLWEVQWFADFLRRLRGTWLGPALPLGVENWARPGWGDGVSSVLARCSPRAGWALSGLLTFARGFWFQLAGSGPASSGAGRG